jgi:hypothetical protein
VENGLVARERSRLVGRLLGSISRVVASAAAIGLALAWSVSEVHAAAPPSDLCALLPASQIGNVLGQPFGAPERSPAPKVYTNTAMGTRCGYESDNGAASVVFIVYMESSPAVAQDTFNRVRAFFWGGGKSTAVAGIGDSAYRDGNGALHVLKGRAHYSIDISPPQGTATPKLQQEQNDLAGWVARQL